MPDNSHPASHHMESSPADHRRGYWCPAQVPCPGWDTHPPRFLGCWLLQLLGFQQQTLADEGRAAQHLAVDLFCGLPSELFQEQADAVTKLRAHEFPFWALGLGDPAWNTASQTKWGSINTVDENLLKPHLWEWAAPTEASAKATGTLPILGNRIP